VKLKQAKRVTPGTVSYANIHSVFTQHCDDIILREDISGLFSVAAFWSAAAEVAPKNIRLGFSDIKLQRIFV
jgi:hypothetical protein